MFVKQPDAEPTAWALYDLETGDQESPTCPTREDALTALRERQDGPQKLGIRAAEPLPDPPTVEWAERVTVSDTATSGQNTITATAERVHYRDAGAPVVVVRRTYRHGPEGWTPGDHTLDIRPAGPLTISQALDLAGTLTDAATAASNNT